MDTIKNYSQFYQWIEQTSIDTQRQLPCFDFLYMNGLTDEIQPYVADRKYSVPYSIYGIPVNRPSRTPKRQLEKIQKEAQKRQMSAEKIWNDYSNIKNIVKELEYERMPADSIAFYRPFHLMPFDEWGIYIYIDKLVHYCENIMKQLNGKLYLFSDLRDILSFVLFEIFHHEFFHHIVECAATTVEIITTNSRGEIRPYYIEYIRKRYQYDSYCTLGEHPDDPLEEALANAYAYNSFSFMSRVKFGYKTAAIGAYQRVIKKVWKQEPPGYCCAEKYINSGYKNGSTLLLAQILFDLNYMTPATIGLIAQSVLLKGHSAFVEKANIPVYLVGSEIALRKFSTLIPAPSETYTYLFLAHDDLELDKKLQDLKAKSMMSNRKN